MNPHNKKRELERSIDELLTSFSDSIKEDEKVLACERLKSELEIFFKKIEESDFLDNIEKLAYETTLFESGVSILAECGLAEDEGQFRKESLRFLKEHEKWASTGYKDETLYQKLKDDISQWPDKPEILNFLKKQCLSTSANLNKLEHTQVLMLSRRSSKVKNLTEQN